MRPSSTPVPHAKLVRVPDTFPKGWDLADELPVGATTEGLIGHGRGAQGQGKKEAKQG